MIPATVAPDDPRIQVGVQLLADLRTEIARADAKATVLVGVLGITAGGLGTLLSDRRWSPVGLSTPAAVLWWVGSATLVAALLALLLAVIPRYRTSGWAPGQPLTYFGDIHRAARVGHLTTALAETGSDPVHGLFVALAETSRIAARKHFWIRTGVVAFGCAAVLLPGSLLPA
ncbi:Pycsar system effector family protein [Streptomyces sp. NPDC050619]|uniref:Pycsar system effector family protein n=1 Tax=Streptomyces sp. NPDC050619 TaxID=3157214 RepID=UPI003430E632